MSTPPPPYGGYWPGYGYPPGYPPPRQTDSLAVVALVCAFVFAPLGIVFGHMSLARIKRTGEDGHGLAVAALVIGYLMTLLTVLAVVLSLVFFVMYMREVANAMDEWEPESTNPTAGPLPSAELPPFQPPMTLGANCQYPATTEPASKPATPPRTGKVPTDPAVVSASLATDRGNIGLQLDNAKAPCTVNSFASLAQQGYFDDTPCHRLTTAPELGVLQCGDPTGSGSGGPGYRFPDEYPANQYRLTDPALRTPVRYPRGTLAMANAGPGTNGSQFFLVYRDSLLPPTYTVFGTIDTTGLATLDDIAAGGVEGGRDDGAPAEPVTITSIRLD